MRNMVISAQNIRVHRIMSLCLGSAKKKDVVFNPVYEPVTDFYLGGKSTTYEGFLDKIYMLHDIGKMRTGEYLFKRMVLLFQQYFGGK